MVHVFIVDPENCPPDYYSKLRDRLSRIPDLTYYVFTTGVAGDETELAHTVENIFEGEQLRLYSCGNITTARNIIDGIHDLSHIELAIVPQTYIGYLSPFGDMEQFTNVENLIDGRIVHTDYIKTNHGLSLNSVVFGIEAYMYKTHDSIASLKLFGRSVPWIMSNIHAMVASPNHTYNIDVDDKSVTRKTTSLILGNVPGTTRFVRWSDNTDITDGAATYAFMYRAGFFSRLIYYFRKMRSIPMDESDDRFFDIGQTENLKVKDINLKPVLCSLDGKLVSATEWKISIVKQGIRLVVPKEATS